MEENFLRNKTKAFSVKIILLFRKLRKEGIEYQILDQLLRSGTSIGANAFEARYAQGKKDFVSKLEIALKECHETEYWLDVLHETNSIPDQDVKSLKSDIIEIKRMLVSSIKTVKEKSNKES